LDNGGFEAPISRLAPELIHPGNRLLPYFQSHLYPNLSLDDFRGLVHYDIR
jgi:hypothetical protein